MRGLEELRRMNDLDAAKFLKGRYEKLRKRAIARQDWTRARRYDREATDFGRFIAGEIKVFPDRPNRKAGLYVPSLGRDFRSVGSEQEVIEN